jgi:DNA segregation ATPase FtsK/SpoIIIE, S-DNA-T family
MVDLHDNPLLQDRLNGVEDFVPEWDVSSVGGMFTNLLTRNIEGVISNPKPSPLQKIHLITGASGWGKTHLFARVAYNMRNRVQFVFVGAPKEIRRAVSYIQWQLVETLFQSQGGLAPIRTRLATLLEPSFSAYLSAMSSSLQNQTKTIRESLKNDASELLQLIAPVTDLSPYHQLADELRTKLPTSRGSVVRALALSLSPASEDARYWLRGESDQISPERLAELRLDSCSPSPTDLVYTVADLFAFTKTPIAIFLDQLDELMIDDGSALRELFSQLMIWLQTIPNLVICLGCLNEGLTQLKSYHGIGPFLDRLQVTQLDPLSSAEATELLARRLRGNHSVQRNPDPVWPFNQTDVAEYVDKQKIVPPRKFLSLCKIKYLDWVAKGRKGTIQLDVGPGPIDQVVDPGQTFEEIWKSTLEKVIQDKPSPVDIHPADFWQLVSELLRLIELEPQAFLPAGMTLTRIDRFELTSSPTEAAKLILVAGGKTHIVIVNANKKDSGQPFNSWMIGLENQLVTPVIGAIILWPKQKLAVGPKAQSFVKYKQRLDSGQIRPFALEQESTTYHQLECLRRMIRLCQAKELTLNNEVLSIEVCRKKVVEGKLLSKLKLLDFLFTGWPGVNLQPAASPPPAISAVPPAPTQVVSLPPASKPSEPNVPAKAVQQTLFDPQPSPKPQSEWAEDILKRATDFFRKRGQHVQPHGQPGYELGPTFVRLKLELKGDADIGKVKRQAENLKVQLKLNQEPLIASQAGYVSIDIQRPDRQTVQLKPLMSSCPAKWQNEAAFPVGQDVAGQVEWVNLAEPSSCHFLVAGTTGSGKSEFLKAMLAGLAARLDPSQIRFMLVDPKRVTFNFGSGSPYLHKPVVYNAEDAILLLQDCFEEMENRYELLQKVGCSDLRELKGPNSRPRWVVIFDEFADLMANKSTKSELEALLSRLGAKARAAGIHLVLGTQRPEASVVTPLLRSNLPGRIGLQVASQRDSKLFLDEPDAAFLLGKGDLVMKLGGGLIRLQSPYVPKADFDQLLRISQ